MLAQRCEAEITAIDIHKESCIQAFDNKELSPWATKIQIKHISLQELSSETTKFDLIISNPPFFNNSLKAGSIERNLARHNDQLSFRDLIFCSKNLLSENGKIALVLPIDAEATIQHEISEAGLYVTRRNNVADNPEKNTKRILLEIERNAKELIIEQLYIRDNSKEYSSEYKKLTTDFYLNF